MPELPEVETTRRGIEPHVVGKKIVQVLVRQPRLRWPVSPELGQQLTGRRISGVSRRAKYLFLETASGKVMLHLGMSGSLRIVQPPLAASKHDHVDIVFEDQMLLRFNDPRRFGSIFWLEGDNHSLLENLGPEPLSNGFTGEYLFRASRQRKLSIKQFIMNASVVVGVGNIYANEALYLAGIRPGIAAGRINRHRYNVLAEAIVQVLKAAIEAGGTTLKDFTSADGSPGYFAQSLNVYGRAGQPCLNCEMTLKEIRQSGRSTVYCPKCQH